MSDRSQALHIVFNSEVEMHVMPHNLALAMEFDYAETEALIRDVHPLGAYLCDRWYNHLDGLRYKRWIWDLAIVSAATHPDWVSESPLETHIQLGGREVFYFTEIDGEKVKADFHESLIEYVEGLQ